MCYKGKCIGCIPVEHGCLVFAVLSAIGTLVVLLACLIIGLLTAAGLIFVSEQVKHNYDMEMPWDKLNYEEKQQVSSVALVGGMAVGVFTFIMCIPSLIAFIFSVLLCNGICKRRPGQVKAYFIYGVTITVLAVLAAIVQMLNSYDRQPGLMTLLGCVIYSLVLVMVFQTYTKFSAGAVYVDHVRLVEKF